MRKRAAICGIVVAGLLSATVASADPYNPGERALTGGLLGAGTGAVIGAIAGGGHGAGIGAAVGGGLGALAGAASTPAPPPRRHTVTITVTSNTVIIEQHSGVTTAPRRLCLTRRCRGEGVAARSSGQDRPRGFQPAGQRRLDRAHVRAGIERMVRIAASASNMAPPRQRTAIPPPDSSMEPTAVPIVYD